MVLNPSENQITQLIYVSKRKSNVDDDEAQKILETSRKNNDTCGIKGVLLVLPEYFFQVVEGPSKNIDELMIRVKNDTRHCELKVLSKKALSGYEFGVWSMVNVNIDTENADSFVVLNRLAKTESPTEGQLKGMYFIFKGLSQPPC